MYRRSSSPVLTLRQADSAKQESVRLKQQLDHALRALDESRALLRQAEEKLVTQSHSQEQHQTAVAQIQQLNLLRESNVTLRDENEKATRKVRSRSPVPR